MKFLPTEEQCGMCEIRIDGKVLGDDDLKALHTSKTFTRIDISSCSGVCDVRLLAGLKQLQELHLGVDGEIENINLLSQLSELRKLSLINTNIQDSDVRCLGLIQKLEGLSLRSCSRVTSCQCIGQLPLLRVLDLSFTGVTDEELLGLSTSCSLVKIGLWDCSDLTDVSPLASIETLEVVDLDGCEGVKTVGALGRLPVLRELDLSCSVITDRELRGISASRSLVRIEVKIWRGLPDVSPLASIKTLKEVVLFACESVSGVLVCIRSLSIDEFREGILRRR
ncbi:leucine-rich repeat protein (LRRP) [Trypanosoma grayi]|uniref:leucine-rich repeat protein (LRRP) n=1 Tax=Trypanosoma grayi TaxID=71804 RepID=UPI0004F421B5|nr:leucine-rich repeat protein (LRRP) [Trypanosoma grayi]KEG10458.1 leucine-rich repeat protein (LRRP) [Trypanosoma grayi]